MEQAKQVATTALRAIEAKQASKMSSTVRLTPPLPAAWPPNGRTFVYAYAARFDPSLHDAERTTPPWGRLVITNDAGRAALAFDERATQLGAAEPQGFRPVGKDDPIVAQQKPAQASVLNATSEAALDAVAVRAYYCAWFRYNGVVAARVRPRHAEFVRWLACKQ